VRRLALSVALLVGFGATPASAELTQNGDLFIRFGGGISPRSLPRHSLAPIGVRIEGTIRVPVHADPPALRRIKIALNQGGHLDSRGLPVCRRRQIDTATASEALAVCGPALVGTGGLTARTSFAEEPSYLARAEILLFNGRDGGHPTILAHVFEHDQAAITRLIVFEIHHNRGPFGTVITGKVPPGINRNGYLKSIYLQLQRNYVFHGHPKAYLSASCSAPAGIEVAAFPFARASMTFDDGRTLASTLVRSCRVSR
jgi:hypothetical protein